MMESHTIGHLLNGVKIHNLLDIGVSKHFISKSFYLNHDHLHKLPKFTTKACNISL